MLRRVIIPTISRISIHKRLATTEVRVEQVSASRPDLKELLHKSDAKKSPEKCGPVPDEDEDDLNEWEEMFIPGPAGIEWNGPTRGGKRPEPTRYGDWERKGRASDF